MTMKYCLLAIATLCLVVVALGDDPVPQVIPIELHFADPTPNSVKIDWKAPGDGWHGDEFGVLGFEIHLGNIPGDNDGYFNLTDVTRGEQMPEDPSDYSIFYSEHTGLIVAFSLKNLGISGEGTLLNIGFLETLGELSVEKCIMDARWEGDQNDQLPPPEINCILPAPVQIPEPQLQFHVTAIDESSVSLGYKLSGWGEVASMKFEVGGMKMDSFTSDLVSCDVEGNGKTTCEGSDVPETAANGGWAHLAQFTIKPNSGSRIFSLINTEILAGRPELTFSVTLPAPTSVPKISVYVDSIQSVDVSSETCGQTTGMCKKSEMEAVIGYLNYDTTVLIAGFQVQLETPSITYISYDVAESNHGFSVSGNEGKFVGFSLTGQTLPASGPEGLPLLIIRFENTLERNQYMKVTEVTLSDTSGAAIGVTIRDLQGMEIPSCNSDPTATICEFDDDDCDCCLNYLDNFPTDPARGCGYCSDVDDNQDIDIVDVIRTVNMQDGLKNSAYPTWNEQEFLEESLKADANNDDVIDTTDVLLTVQRAMKKDIVLTDRPCVEG